MAWAKITKAPLHKSERLDPPEGLWQKCTACHSVIYKKDFIANQNVCTKCDHHFMISATKRVHAFVDTGTFKPLDGTLFSNDPLHFSDTKSYRSRIDEAEKKGAHHDAFLAGEALLHGMPIQIGAMDFQFMGGSMGSVVGEKLKRVFLRAAQLQQPAVVFSASGGARMQEGILSLMQMAKTCAALAQLKEAGVPFLSILTNPTTGGVAASYALLGDINIGEPGALIGFAGPRVIEQTIRESLPEGFQTSEFLLQHGMLDMICHRNALRDRVAELLYILTKRSAVS
jgi:acetyl-CoA carboxylase carboxyl transferase subunit beta